MKRIFISHKRLFELLEMYNRYSNFVSAIKVTFHCLLGCSVGEIIGLIIGVQFDLSNIITIALATILAFLFGFFFAIFSLKKRKKLNFIESFKIIWLGELVSISTMELAMNFVDYYMGGMNVNSIFNPIFWSAFAYAFVAGYLLTVPVNYIMINLNKKTCCH